MNLEFADWAIVLGLLVFLIVMAGYTRRYSRSVVNFLAAGRCAGRYLIAVAEGVAGWGAISAVAAFEMYYKAGFSIQWWFFITLMAYIVISMSGWMTYRFRQTRCLTIAQYLEKRYSKRFRIFAGILAWFSGTLNFGLFPAVGARFFVYFCGLPATFPLWGMAIPTFAVVMAILLLLALYFIFIGGQVAVIVTDFLQGLFCNVVFIVLMFVLLGMFSWPQITEALNTAPAGESMLNPFQSSKTADFNVWFYILVSFGLFYGWMTWQGTQGYRTAAKSPHEARMAMIVNNWRAIAQQLIIILIPICAFTFLHHADFAEKAGRAHNAIAQIVGRNTVETETLQTQMTVPVAMSVFLKTGLMGAICAVMLAAFISTHDTYLHSWGSIFIQDVVMPFRKKPLSQKQHINLLRLSIVAVAVIIFLIGLFYRQNEYILMFMAFTGTIFVGGAGAAVIGGLYWKRGTTSAAWTALICGVVMAFAGAMIRRYWKEFPVNSQWVSFITAITCTLLYVSISLLQRKQCDMDKMLHRGKYAVADDIVTKEDVPVRGLRALIGMGKEFTRVDKIIYISSIGWTLSLIAVFAVGTLINLIFYGKITNDSWAKFWWVYIIVHVVLSVITTIWFLIGGVRDYREMFRLLKIRKSSEEDDGRVLQE